jgi:hypothetical protein
LFEEEVCEAVMLEEVVRDSALTSADSCEFLAEAKSTGEEKIFTSTQTNQHFANLS